MLPEIKRILVDESKNETFKVLALFDLFKKKADEVYVKGYDAGFEEAAQLADEEQAIEEAGGLTERLDKELKTNYLNG